MLRSDTNYAGDEMGSSGTKKHRLSRIIGGKNDNPSDRPLLVNQHDSAYASSENAENIVQVENDGAIPNTNSQQNLALNRRTGEVFDEDTGQVVTVVTTTTTTTTTTTMAGGKKQQQDVTRDVQTVQHPQPHPTTTAAATGNVPGHTSSHAPGHAPSYVSGYNPGHATGSGPSHVTGSGPSHGTENVPNHIAGNHTGNVPGHVSGHSPVSYLDNSHHSSEANLSVAPVIPPRSQSRHSTELPANEVPDYSQHSYTNSVEPPVSPVRPNNFSYPQRAVPSGTSLASSEDSTTRSRPSKLADLKAAAIGLHGVGETLRGTFNSSIDQNFPRRDPSRMTASDAKNQAAINRGRQEMASLPQHGLRSHPPNTTTEAMQSASLPSHHETTNPSYPNRRENTNLSHHTSTPTNTAPGLGPTGTANDGSHSAVFGLTPDGHKSLDTDPSVQRRSGEVSTNPTATGHVPPRGTAVRTSSDAAPTPVTGEVERTTSAHDSAVHGKEKKSTISKLFKRKPVGTTNTPGTVDPNAKNDAKRYY